MSSLSDSELLVVSLNAVCHDVGAADTRYAHNYANQNGKGIVIKHGKKISKKKQVA